jgi:hypothetical protein
MYLGTYVGVLANFFLELAMGAGLGSELRIFLFLVILPSLNR